MPRSEDHAGPTRTTPIVLLALAGLLLLARIGVGVRDVVSPESRPELVDWVSVAEATHLWMYYHPGSDPLERVELGPS